MMNSHLTGQKGDKVKIMWWLTRMDVVVKLNSYVAVNVTSTFGAGVYSILVWLRSSKCQSILRSDIYNRFRLINVMYSSSFEGGEGVASMTPMAVVAPAGCDEILNHAFSSSADCCFSSGLGTVTYWRSTASSRGKSLVIGSTGISLGSFFVLF